MFNYDMSKLQGILERIEEAGIEVLRIIANKDGKITISFINSETGNKTQANFSNIDILSNAYEGFITIYAPNGDEDVELHEIQDTLDILEKNDPLCSTANFIIYSDGSGRIVKDGYGSGKDDTFTIGSWTVNRKGLRQTLNNLQAEL